MSISQNRVSSSKRLVSSSRRRVRKGGCRGSTSNRRWRVRKGGCQIGKASGSVSEQSVKRRVLRLNVRVASVEFK